MRSLVTGIKKIIAAASKNRAALIFLLLLVAIFVWYFAPYYHRGLPLTHDGSNHLARFAAYYLAVKDGQIPPRLGTNLLNGFSYPVFNYNYPLPNILSLPFSVLDFHFETTLKILMMASTALGLSGVYYWLAPLVKKHFKNADFRANFILFLLLLVFLFNPYLVNAIWIRGTIGEVLALGILPWLFAALDQRRAPLLILTTTFLILAHNVFAMLGIGVLLVLALFERKFFWTFKQVIIGILLSAWFWVPAIFEKQLIILDNVSLSTDFAQHFVTWSQLFTVNLSRGFSEQGGVDGLGFGMGLVFWLGLALSVLALLSRKIKKIKFFVICGLIILFLYLQTASSHWLWSILPLVNFIQFPWRLAALAQILLLWPLAQVLVKFKITQWLVIGVLILTVIINWPLDLDNDFHFERDYWLSYPMTTSTNNENLPKTFTYDYANFVDRANGPWLIFESGEVAAIAQIQKWTGHEHIYDFEIAAQPTVNEASFSAGVPAGVVVENIAYFPGWQTKVNGEKVDYVDNEKIGGRIAFVLPATTENIHVETKFTGFTWTRLVANLISVGTLVILMGGFFWRQKR